MRVLEHRRFARAPQLSRMVLLIGLARLAESTSSFNQVLEYVELTEELWGGVATQTQVPEGFPKLPAGCSCVNDVQNAATCTSFNCHAICDLTIGTCDPGCCSDPDCTEDQVTAFQTAGTCKDDGAQETLKMCTDMSSLDKVNEKYNLYVDTDDDPLTDLLCVSVANSPFEGSYIPSHTDLLDNVGIIDSPTIQPEYSFSAEEDSLNTELDFYTSGVNIAAAMTEEGALKSIWGGSLRIPNAGADGTCNLHNLAKFNEEVTENHCIVQVSNLKSMCQDEWSAISSLLYLDRLRIGMLPLASISDTSGSSWVTVDKGEIVKKDVVSGETVLLQATGVPFSDRIVPSSQAPTVFDSQANASEAPTLTPSGAPSNAPSSGPTLEPTSQPTKAPITSGRRALSSPVDIPLDWDESEQTCRNAVVGVRYIVYHNAEGRIIKTSIDLQVSNITDINVTAQAGITQEHLISFVNVDKNEAATSEPFIPRSVSGNPGYIFGLPVQSGKFSSHSSESEESQRAVLYNPNGLGMMLAPGPKGSCITRDDVPWWEALQDAVPRKTSVLFGVDTSSSCSVELTYSDFQSIDSWCKNISGIPLLELKDTAIGIYGNADPLKVWDWVTLKKSAALSKTEPSSPRGQLFCSNMIDGIEIEILWTNSGEVSNPQPMILAARAKFSQSDWQWKKAPSEDQTQRFTLSHIVKFVEYVVPEEEAIDYKPEVGVVLPQLPYDVFYPFDILVSSGSTTRVGFALIVPMLYTWLNA